jgi:putative addiction module component (TIGR02574 family)
MTSKARSLLDQALKLPPKARAELADELLSSLVGDEDAFDDKWRREIVRRLRDYLADGDRGDTAHVVLARIRAKLKA